MTQDEIMEMWNSITKYAPSEVRITEFANLVAAKEREACALVVDARLEKWLSLFGKDKMYKWMLGLPKAIRARGEA